MPPALFASPFPRLDLTVDEREHLHETATALINDVQTLYENFLWDAHSTIDAGQWALTRAKEDVRVYHDRRPGAGTGNKDMHLLLTVGSVLGDLSDAMYGVLNHTTDAMRIKTAYVQDTLLDSAVLESILAPTLDDPFQSMTVRWFVKGVPLHVRAISKHRDNVYLEATGMKTLANGEPVGFHLMHSISFTKTPRLPMYDRFNMSICTLWRQATPQRVEAFMTSYIEIKESFLVPMVVKSTADALVSLWKVIECAQRKKLSHLVSHKAAIVAHDVDASRGSVLELGCSVCGSHSRSARRGAKSSCAVCSKTTCKKCRVKRELAFLAPDGAMLSLAVRFCVSCFTAARRLDAVAVAQEEAGSASGSHGSHGSSGGVRFRRGAPTATSSSTSSMSDAHTCE